MNRLNDCPRELYEATLALHFGHRFWHGGRTFFIQKSFFLTSPAPQQLNKNIRIQIWQSEYALKFEWMFKVPPQKAKTNVFQIFFRYSAGSFGAQILGI